MGECPRCEVDCVEEANFCHVCGTSLETSDMHVVASSDPLAGRVIADRYRIQSLVGRGGMGVVYRGEHVHMGKTVAIKLLHGELASKKDQVKRFKREAQAISRLSNIHTVTIFDYGKSQGLMFLVMEFLEGRDVGWVLRSEGHLDFVRTLMILVQLCDSLAEAHDSGIVHRDLKPENVFLIEKRDMKDFVKVLDFGLAKVRMGIERPDETAHGAILGTPYYMSPEQIRGEEIDNRADIYALGGLMFAMLTGHPPYRAPTPLAVMARHLTDPVPDLDAQQTGLEPDCISAITPVYQRCLAKEPQERYESVETLKHDLLALIEARWAEDQASSSPRLPPITGEFAAARPPSSSDSDSPARIKEEFERFERRLRMRRALGFTTFAAVVVAGIALGAWVMLGGAPATRAVGDAEPNDSPSTAAPIEPGTPVSGTLGRRISDTESDHDWYVFDVPPGEPRLVRVHLRRIPNVDAMLQLFRSGSTEAIAFSRSGGPGEDEAITGVMLEPGPYYVLVRQDLASGGRPLESITDTYQLEVQMLDASVWEAEPDDTVDRAVVMVPGSSRKGFVGHGADRDVFCVKSPGAALLSAELVGPPGLVMSLASVDLESGRWTTVRGDGPGTRIVITDLAIGAGSGLCLQVWAAESGHDPLRPYTLTVK